MALLKDHLIAHYKMNDDAATAVVVDSIGNHNGTYKDAGGDLNTDTGASTGKINGALDFDGTDEYVEIADHDDFTPTLTPFSISAWCYMHSIINFKIASKGVYNIDGEWRLETEGNTKLFFGCHDESVANCRIGRKTSALSIYINQWVHVVVTYDGGTSNSSIKLYLNSNQSDNEDAGSNESSFVSIENLNHAIWIGRYSTSHANGLVDNVMFFNKELTLSEVRALYNDGNGTENIPIGIQLSRTGHRFSSFPEN